MGLVIKSPMHAYICKTHFVVDRASELKQNAALTHVLDPSCPHEPPPCQTGSQECASALLVYICLRRLCRHPCTPLQVCNCLPWHMSAHCSKLGWPPSPQRPMFPNMHSASHALIGTDEPVKSQVPGSSITNQLITSTTMLPHPLPVSAALPSRHKTHDVCQRTAGIDKPAGCLEQTTFRRI